MALQSSMVMDLMTRFPSVLYSSFSDLNKNNTINNTHLAEQRCESSVMGSKGKKLFANTHPAHVFLMSLRCELQLRKLYY